MPVRNAESRFAQIPQSHIDRSVLDRSHGHTTTFNVGEIIPILVDQDVLPGDTISMKVSSVLRLQTLLTPIMSGMVCDIMAFATPYRLLWDHWREFNGENTAGPWAQTTQYKIPCISAPSGGFVEGTIADYFGWPLHVDWNSQAECAPNVMGLRAYSLCCSEWLRDQNLTYPLNTPTGDTNQIGSNGSNYINDVANGGKPFIAAKLHDFFTTMLPSAQKAAQPVSFPLLSGSQAEVYAGAIHAKDHNDSGLLWTNADNNTATFTINRHILNGPYTDNHYAHTMVQNETTSVAAVSNLHLTPANLWADLSTNVGAVTINQMRLAFQLQRYFEKLARQGSRYTETIRSFFGVVSPDARQQRPEYLGGIRFPINVSEVVNHAQTSTDFLGDLGATSKTGNVDNLFTKSFTEHSVLLVLAVVRYPHIYTGLEPQFMRRNLEDFYLPVFANIGEQPYYTASIYPDATNMATKKVFGYQEAWGEYRYAPSKVTGLMRPQATGSLAHWNLADNYSSEPTLSDAWIREDKNIVDRVLAVSSSVSNQVLGDFWFDATYTRPMPVYSVPGLIDHN